ncbi:response regulator transcription factor [Sphingomonas crocodyli]|uniref:Response regulator n=1 Tax=Sphingomonas crocodyli TaxID=1979270 RepID=A0A437LZR3_9SPHN|nr:response regulator [Sphingomonas crocodyli]RVT90910.1 response regulator [Sphingomonas crocodyli]
MAPQGSSVLQPVIAVVDDDVGMRDALSELIEVLDFQSRTFDGGRSLLASYQPGAFDCVVSDMRMPGMDGLELQRRLRELDDNLPLIFVTSYDDDITRARALELGARNVLVKPVNADRLLDELVAALESRPPKA